MKLNLALTGFPGLSEGRGYVTFMWTSVTSMSTSFFMKGGCGL